MAYPKRNYSREKRKKQIIGQFNIWHQNGDTEPKTMYRIARALGMTPAKTFKDILDEMVMEGSLTVEKRNRAGRWTSDNYSVIKSLITEKLGKRRLVIRHKGDVFVTVDNPYTQQEIWS